MLHHSRAPIDAGSRGYEILLEDGRVAVGLHHMWPGNSLKVATKASIPIERLGPRHRHLRRLRSGRRPARLSSTANRRSAMSIRDGLTKDITYEGGEPNLAIGNRFRDNGFKGGAVDDLRVFNRELTAIEAAHLAGRPDLRGDDPVRDYFATGLATIISPRDGRHDGTNCTRCGSNTPGCSTRFPKRW